MEISIRTKCLRLNKKSHENFKEFIKYKLRAFDSLIKKVQIRLNDLNGFKGGIDKACRAEVVLVNSKRVAVETRSFDSGKALLQAMDIMAVQVARKSKRIQKNERTWGLL